MKKSKVAKTPARKPSGFSMNTAQTLSILRSIPWKTKCFQVDEEQSRQCEYIGTAREVLSAVDIDKQLKANLHWNRGKETIFPVDLSFMDIYDVNQSFNTDDPGTGECCLLVRYRSTLDHLDFPKLSEPVRRRPMRCINVSRKRATTGSTS